MEGGATVTAPELPHLTPEERDALSHVSECRSDYSWPDCQAEATLLATALNAARAEVARMREAVSRIIGPAVEDAAAKRTERELLLDQTTRERDEARAEVARLKAELDDADRYLLQVGTGRWRNDGEPDSRDHACAQCVPHSDMLVEGFVCAFHRAKARQALEPKP